MHVLEPGYALAASAVYAPHAAPLTDASDNATRLSLPNLVFVQPSPYGNDNSCQLDALRKHGKGRAVVAFNPDAPDAHLRDLHARGARGVRINLKSVGRELPPDELTALLGTYAERVAPLGGWAVQIYADLALMPHVERAADVVLGAGAKLVVDHLGAPPHVAADMSTLPGWDALLRLLGRRGAYVKVSGAYRFSGNRDPGYDYREWGPAVGQLLATRGGKAVVYASDWPHTRHEYADPQPWLQRCLEWCEGDDTLANDLFRDNARRLWDAQGVEAER